jgi:hypothetical protein
MSYKYIPQINNQNFVYPNAYLAEYDVDIVQNINDNYVSGTTASFAATGTTSTGMTITFDYTWSKNSADVFVSNGTLKVLSLHMLAGGQNYFKPWRLVGAITSASTGATSLSGTATFAVTPAMLGLTTFVTGTYYFEVRMIGTKAIYPICQTLSITI